jgi:hypothetical protein
VVDHREELELSLELFDRFLVPTFQRLEMTESHVGSDDEHAFLPREERLLQRDGPPSRDLTSCKIA